MQLSPYSRHADDVNTFAVTTIGAQATTALPTDSPLPAVSCPCLPVLVASSPPEEAMAVDEKKFEVQVPGVPVTYYDALPYVRALIADGLRTAREQAGLSQMDLARKLKKARTKISAVEAGEVVASERYFLGALRVCGLPFDWKPARR